TSGREKQTIAEARKRAQTAQPAQKKAEKVEKKERRSERLRERQKEQKSEMHKRAHSLEPRPDRGGATLKPSRQQIRVSPSSSSDHDPSFAKEIEKKEERKITKQKVEEKPEIGRRKMQKKTEENKKENSAQPKYNLREQTTNKKAEAES